MNKYTKKTLLIALITAAASLSSQAVDTISWGTGTFKAYASDGITLLPGSASSSVGGFVQLIYLGTDGIYNGYVAGGSGVTGDDLAVQTLWMGAGVMSNPAGQFFSSSYASSYAIGSKFEIRFFDTASSNYAGGVAPVTGYYGLSQIFTSTGDPDLGGSDAFGFNQNYSATTAVVPEPSTVALMLAGLGVLGFARRRK